MPNSKLKLQDRLVRCEYQSEGRVLIIVENASPSLTDAVMRFSGGENESLWYVYRDKNSDIIKDYEKAMTDLDSDWQFELEEKAADLAFEQTEALEEKMKKLERTVDEKAEDKYKDRIDTVTRDQIDKIDALEKANTELERKLDEKDDDTADEIRRAKENFELEKQQEIDRRLKLARKTWRDNRDTIRKLKKKVKQLETEIENFEF